MDGRQESVFLQEATLDEVFTHSLDRLVEGSVLEAREEREGLVTRDSGSEGSSLGALGLLAGNLARGDVVLEEDIVHVVVREGS